MDRASGLREGVSVASPRCRRRRTRTGDTMIHARVRRREPASGCTPGGLPMPVDARRYRRIGESRDGLGHGTDVRGLNLGA
jgi:hypothetical protein